MQKKISLFLPDQNATLALGGKLGRFLSCRTVYPAVLFRGELGAGKTTMIRGIVSALPGGDQAEISSPSFNLVNIYPTSPQTAHVDLYRLGGMDLDEFVQEILLSQDMLVLVEWSEYLSPGLTPADRIEVALSFSGESRTAVFSFHGTGEKFSILIEYSEIEE